MYKKIPKATLILRYLVLSFMNIETSRFYIELYETEPKRWTGVVSTEI